jgi:hypothetical protein
MRAFTAAVAADETFRPADLKLRLSPEEAIVRLSGAYNL